MTLRSHRKRMRGLAMLRRMMTVIGIAVAAYAAVYLFVWAFTGSQVTASILALVGVVVILAYIGGRDIWSSHE